MAAPHLHLNKYLYTTAEETQVKNIKLHGTNIIIYN